MMTPEEVRVAMDRVPLPEGMTWYDVAGQKLFEVRGQSGGFSVQLIAYLIVKRNRSGKEQFFKYGIEFNTGDDNPSVVQGRIMVAITTFNEHLMLEPESNVDMDGGSLGREGF